MSELLKRAEAYYLVAEELKVNATRMMETSIMLSEWQTGYARRTYAVRQ